MHKGRCRLETTGGVPLNASYTCDPQCIPALSARDWERGRMSPFPVLIRISAPGGETRFQDGGLGAPFVSETIPAN